MHLASNFLDLVTRHPVFFGVSVLSFGLNFGGALALRDIAKKYNRYNRY